MWYDLPKVKIVILKCIIVAIANPTLYEPRELKKKQFLSHKSNVVWS